MTKIETIITLDLGTTSCRALLFDLKGNALAQASRTYPLHTPRPGFAEQEPETLLAAADSVVADVVMQAGDAAGKVLGVSLCTYMHSLIALDADGRYLSPFSTWADIRSAQEVEEVRSRDGWAELYARTGCPPHTMYPLYRFIWFRKHEPELLARAYRFVTIKELLIHRWTGQWLVDCNLASGSGLFNMRTLTWDPGALELAGVRPEQLNPAVPTVHTVPLNTDRLGLPLGTPVVVGAGDGVLSSLGSGAIAPGVVAAMVGTSGAIRACVREPVADPQARVFCYYLDEGHYILGGSLNNGGIALRWMRDQFYPGVRLGFLALPGGRALAGLQRPGPGRLVWPGAGAHPGPHGPFRAGGRGVPAPQRAGPDRGAGRSGYRDPGHRRLCPFALLAADLRRCVRAGSGGHGAGRGLQPGCAGAGRQGAGRQGAGHRPGSDLGQPVGVGGRAASA
jgi:sugar (pentulose or hexulose) kinase